MRRRRGWTATPLQLLEKTKGCLLLGLVAGVDALGSGEGEEESAGVEPRRWLQGDTHS